MEVLLTELPKRKDLIGKQLNMIAQGGEFHYDYQDVPHYRIFKSAKFRKETNGTWVYWYWEKHNFCERHNTPDCGYSGALIEEKYPMYLKFK